MAAGYTMTIDGKSVKGSKSTGVINPATGKIFAEVPDCSKAELDQAMNAAQKAFPSWSKDINARRKVLQDCAAALQQPPEGLARTLTLEQGKPLDKAGQEIMGTSMWCAYTAMLDLPAEVLQDTPQGKIEIKRKPLGVVAAITPWNYPLMLGMWKIAPALLAGNTIVLKPSPYTPITTLMLGEILRDIVPPGVLNVISGGDELGSWMTTHPVPRKISFTGSVETGKRVAAAAAPDLKRVTLELGGNDAAIILADVDPAAVAQKIFWGAFENSGQICSAIKRVYVPEQMYKALLDNLGEIAKGVKVGDGLEAGTQLGPINNKMQFERVTELVEDAKKHGAKIVSADRASARRDTSLRRPSSGIFPMACGWSTKSSSAPRSRSFLTRMSTMPSAARTRRTSASAARCGPTIRPVEPKSRRNSNADRRGSISISRSPPICHSAERSGRVSAWKTARGV